MYRIEGRGKKKSCPFRLLALETENCASYSLESFEFDYCTKSDET